MSVAPALTGGELTALALASGPRWYAVFDTASGSNVVGTARIDNPSGITYPIATLPIKSQSAGWSAIQPGQIVFVGSTASGFDRGIFRVRWDNFLSSPNLETEQIGAGSSGEIALTSRSTPISNDDYVTVLYRFDPFSVDPRIDYNAVGVDATIYEDYDRLTYATSNRYPPPIVNITIDGQPANYGTHVYGNTSKTFDISFVITLWPTSASATYVITLPAGWTLNSGSLTGSTLTGTINVTAPHSADSYVLKLAATENNGSVFTAYRKLWICSNTYPPLSIVSIDSRTDDRTGSRRTVTFNSLTNVQPGAMWHLFDMGTWGGSDVATASKCFTGYVQTRRENTDVGVSNVSLDLIGPSYVMDLIGSQSQIMSAVNATPSSWQELYYGLSYLDFIIWWILYHRASGFLQMFNYTPFGLTSSQKRMTDWRIDTGTLLSQVKAQAVRYGGGNFGCDPTGEFMLRRHVSRIPEADRSSVPVRASLTASIYKHADLGYEQRPQVRRVRGEAFVSDGLSTNTPYWSDAPQVAGQGQREEKAERLIVDDTGELWVFTGNHYQALNNPYPSGSILILKNWAVFYPAQMPRIYLTIPANLRYDGVAWTGYVLPTQVSYTHNPDGTIDTQISIEAETVGYPGVDVPIPVVDPTTGTSPYQFIPFAPVPPWRSPNPNPAGTPAGPAVILKDGSIGFGATSTKAYVVSNLFGTPKYRDVTPTGLGSFTIRHGFISVGSKRAYLLVSDGTNSKVYTTTNVFAATPVWSVGASIAGVYTLIRAGNAVGTVEIANSGTTDVLLYDYDFSSSNGGWAAGFPTAPATYSSGRWNSAHYNNGIVGQADSLYITKAIASAFITTVRIVAYATYAANGGGRGVNGVVAGDLPSGAGAIDTTVTLNDTFTGMSVDLSSNNTGDSATTSGKNYITRIVVRGSPSTTVPAVATSTDFGATWNTPQTYGTTVGISVGFDTQHNGTVSYLGATGKVGKATSIGGAYSDDQGFTTNPLLIETPWSRWGSSALDNTGSSPDYIVGLASADGSGRTLYKIASGVQVNVTPTIGGQPGIPAGPDCLTTYLGKYIAYLASFAGTKHLVTSKDAGATWTDRGAVDAIYARVRRLANQPGQFYLAGNVFDYTSTFGAKLISKTKPSTSALVFFEAYN